MGGTRGRSRSINAAIRSVSEHDIRSCRLCTESDRLDQGVLDGLYRLFTRDTGQAIVAKQAAHSDQ
jgi:hypothetical protein